MSGLFVREMEPLWSPAEPAAISCKSIEPVNGESSQNRSPHSKQGGCRGLPPVAGGPLPANEGVALQAPQERRVPQTEGSQDSGRPSHVELPSVLSDEPPGKRRSRLGIGRARIANGVFDGSFE